MNRFNDIGLILSLVALLSLNTYGSDSLRLSKIDEISDWLETDSTGIAGVLSNRTEQIYSPVLYSQNVGGIRNNFSPDFSLNSFGSPLWFSGFDQNSDYVRSDSTITIGSYQFGFNDVHDFKATYADNIYGTYLNLDFERISAVSLFPNSDNRVFKFRVNAENKEGRISQRYGFYRNSNSLQHNGGIWSDSSLVEPEEISAFSIPSNLTNANSEFSNWGIYIGNEIHMNYVKPKVDTLVLDSSQVELKVDSIFSDSVSSSVQLDHYLGYRVGIEKESFIFNMDQGDIDSLLLSAPMLDQSRTWDSIGFNQRFISVDYTLRKRSTKEYFKLSLQGERYDLSELDRTWIQSDFSWGAKNGYNSYIRYYLDGLWKDGYKAKLWYKGTFRNSLSYNFGLLVDKKRPGFLHMKYQGNHYQWDQILKPVNRQAVNANLFLKDLGLQFEGEYSVLNDWVYYDSLSTVQQFDGEIIYYDIQLKHHWRNKHLRLYTVLRHQGSNSDKIRMPDFLLSNTFAYYFKIGKLNFTSGLVTTYFTGYKAQAFNPNLRTFYLQDDHAVGNFPHLTAFFSVRIGGADLFLKGENLLFDTVSRSYYVYPQMTSVPRFIRIGFNWRFRN